MEKKYAYLKYSRKDHEVYYRITGGEIIAISKARGVRKNKALQILNINDYEVIDQETFNAKYKDIFQQIEL